MIQGHEPATAFVDNRSSSYEDNEVHYGLTIRQHFAALAMQGLLAADWNGCKTSSIVSKAVEVADVLIVELNKND